MLQRQTERATSTLSTATNSIISSITQEATSAMNGCTNIFCSNGWTQFMGFNSFNTTDPNGENRVGVTTTIM